MAWIEVHQALPTHRKTLALADELGIEPSQAVGHLVCFWLWALDNAPGGDLGEVTSRTIARAAGWRKNPDAFAGALRKAGLLDGNTIHNWNDYAGRLVEKRAANRERMRSSRAAKEHPPTPPTNGERAAHVQSTNGARAGATVPNRTVPNQTLPCSTPSGVAPTPLRAVPREPVPKPEKPPNMLSQLWAKVRALDADVKLFGEAGRNGAKLKENAEVLDLDLLAEALVARAHGEWTTPYLDDTGGAVWACIGELGKFDAWRGAQSAPEPAAEGYVWQTCPACGERVDQYGYGHRTGRGNPCDWTGLKPSKWPAKASA